MKVPSFSLSLQSIELVVAVLILLAAGGGLVYLRGQALSVEVPAVAANNYGAGVTALTTETQQDGVFLEVGNLIRPSTTGTQDVQVTEEERGKASLFSAQ